MGDVDSYAARVGASRDWTMSISLFDPDHNLVHHRRFPPVCYGTEETWREVLGVALSHQCSCLLLDHYVPDGDTNPDARRILLTRRLFRMLRPLDLRLCDHVIRSDHAAFSFRANGLL